jgi:4a-hydroxytetrahydrobiopterin dehydratase
MAKMTESDVRSALDRAAQWSQTGESIQRTLKFKNFLESMAFVNAIAAQAEKVNHHPDILIRYNKVTLTLSTHDAGGLTRKDFDLAAIIDGMVPATA